MGTTQADKIVLANSPLLQHILPGAFEAATRKRRERKRKKAERKRLEKEQEVLSEDDNEDITLSSDDDFPDIKI